MTYVLGSQSMVRLQGVHPSLVKVVERAIQTTPQDFIVIEGVRSHDAMCVNWGKGRTGEQCAAAGVPTSYAQPGLAKVTWLADPFHSNHRVMADGFGHAVDLGAVVNGAYDGATVSRYDAISQAMFSAAAELGVRLRWGGNWDGDDHPHEPGETDIGHFELGALAA